MSVYRVFSKRSSACLKAAGGKYNCNGDDIFLNFWCTAAGVFENVIFLKIMGGILEKKLKNENVW